MADPSRPDVDRRARAVRLRAAASSEHATTTRARGSATRTTSPGRARWPRAAQWLRTRRARSTTGSCCSSTSSIRTSRSTRPSRGRRCTTRTGTATAPDLAAVRRRRDRRRACSTEREGRQIRAQLRRQADDDRPLVRARARRARRARRCGTTPRSIVCTDHGHYLGERRDRTSGASPACPLYEPTRPHPAARRVAGRRAAARRATRSRRPSTCTPRSPTCSASSRAHRTHGRSLVPLLDGEADVGPRVGARAASGAARCTSSTAERHVRARARSATTSPLSMWSNRWSTMPIARAARAARCPRPTTRAVLDRMPGSDVPVIRQPFAPATCCRSGPRPGSRGNHLYDLDDDPDEEHEPRRHSARGRDGRAPPRRVARDGSAARSARALGPRLGGATALPSVQPGALCRVPA